jgi:hypothetical protein
MTRGDDADTTAAGIGGDKKKVEELQEVGRPHVNLCQE